MSIKTHLTTLIVIGASINACRPATSTTGSVVQSVTGVDESNHAAGFGFLPVRNFVTAPLGAHSTDPGVSEATTMVNARLFALVECGDLTTRLGPVSAARLLDLLEPLGASDNLYLTAARQIITKIGSGEIDKYSSPRSDAVTEIVPCHLFGTRLLTWDVIADLQTRAAGLPENEPAAGSAAETAAKRVYLANQTLFLSLRGNYDPNRASPLAGKVNALIEMATTQSGANLTADELTHRLLKSDEIYNPCIMGRGPEGVGGAYLAAWKTSNFSCVRVPGTNVSSYQAGAGNGANYVKIRNQLALAIARTDDAVHAGNAGDLDLARLWDVLTDAQPWTRVAGAPRAIAEYLTSGRGFNFTTRFASQNAQYRFGTTLLPSVTDNPSTPIDSLAAPFLTTPVNPHRIRPIYRAGN